MLDKVALVEYNSSVMKTAKKQTEMLTHLETTHAFKYLRYIPQVNLACNNWCILHAVVSIN